ncbi:MAG: transglycosylase domain-containing protein [Fibrobacteres bacterium]|nr:transglycosylase domain-containing protein [Fibrobacterota bacterium]
MAAFPPSGKTPSGFVKARRGWAALLLALPLIPIVHGLFDARLKARTPSLHLLDRNWRFIAALDNGQGDFGYWDMPDSLPPALIAAALAAEDRRFASHPGIDARAVAGAFRDHYLRRGPQRGASTLAMQVARLQRSGGAGWYWKIHDAAAALGLTARLGRTGILRAYFRDAPYGNRISGAACAARRYFRKPVQDVSLAEAALLAALPKAPSRYNLFDVEGFAGARRRAALILKRAQAYGFIDAEKRDGALAELASLDRPARQSRDPSVLHYLRQAAVHTAAAHTAVPAHPRGEERTTLDLAVQDTLQSLLRRELPQLLKWEAGNAAALVLDVRRGQVLAYVGSQGYFDPRGGAIDFANLPRSTGSLLKPFIYAMGMEWKGYTAATVLDDQGHDFGTGNHSFVPEDYDHKYLGPVLYKNALANSRNIPAVEVLKAVGVDEFYRRCVALGLARDDGQAGHYGLGLSIGGLYCSLQQVAEAYLALANQGERRPLVWELPDSATGRTAVEPESAHAEPERVMPADIAMMIRRFLADPVARLPGFPRGGNLEYPFAVSVKTGTSEGYRDSWCMAFSDTYLVGVWIGNADFSPTKGLSGYEGAARIAKRMLYALHPDRLDGLRDGETPYPPGYVPVPICRLTGKRADRFTPYVTTEYFKPGTEPLEYSDAQQTLPVDARNGLLAYPGCPVPIRWKRFTVLEPRYREWAAAQGLEVPPDRYSPECGGQGFADRYALSITSPRGGSRFFIDPEMPEGASVLPIACRIDPAPATVLWLADGEEVAEVKFPFTLKWPMRAGPHTFQAVVPGTNYRSATVRLEVY